MTNPTKRCCYSRNLHFYTENQELELVLKCWIISLRAVKKIAGISAKAYIQILPSLSLIIGARNLATISNIDFIETEKLISSTHKKTTPARLCGYLEQFGSWLNINFGSRIS
ncbi:MAG: hypothetical protein HN691_00840, partial [Bacteroidetes bacterium]|nr:hypothetical protein [Bacteroidota bacterium]